MMPARFLTVLLLLPALSGSAGAVEVRKIRPGQPDDASLEEEVRRTLTGRIGLELRRVEIDVQDGNLTLSGAVPSLHDGSEAERLCAAVHGLKTIRNEIRVERNATPDSLLQLNAMRAMEASPRLRSFGLKASVTEAVLTLTGEVPLARDRLEAERLATRVEGIVELRDEIRVAPAPVDPGVIERRLRRLLGDKMILGGVDDLEVSVTDDGVVTLAGVTASHVDRLQAERIAYGLPGVTAVKNHIRVRLQGEERP